MVVGGSMENEIPLLGNHPLSALAEGKRLAEQAEEAERAALLAWATCAIPKFIFLCIAACALN